MALKKSELYSSLWSSCDELRGGMDASQYKDYVLVLLFIKYVSDKYAGQPYAPITIPEGASFQDLVALKGKPDIGDQINKRIVGPLAKANQLADMPDFNDANKLGSGKELVERLTNLIAIFENKALDFSKNRADGDDILGDAYEYLMRHFASESGIRKGYIKGLIGLPANLFYGTGIPACIVVLDKRDAHARKGIFMIDASTGFMKDGAKNRLRAQDIHRIVDVFTRQREVPRYARMVGFEEIERNDFNLNLPRYIDSQTPEDVQDIAAHLQGGIPVADVEVLEPYWAVCPQLRQHLFRSNRPGYLDLNLDKASLQSSIVAHSEFAAFIAGLNAHFEDWRVRSAVRLKVLQPGFHPKALIVQLADDLLDHYQGQPLIDPYAVYQHLMDYWDETMQDDAYLIAADGWKVETSRIIEVDKKGRQKDKGWTCDLIPKPYIVARYFAEEQAAIDRLAGELESVSAQLAELEEEHGGEDGVFAELDKVNKANVSARLREIKRDPEAQDEVAVLDAWLKLNGEEADLKKRLKEAENRLDAKVYAQYPQLTETEIKTLVVEDKWLAALAAAIHGEMDRLSQQLTGRVKELAERYETPMPQMSERVAELEAKVNRHLERMGFAV